MLTPGRAGSLVGPFAGGWLVDHVSWRAVFLLNIALILGAVLGVVPVPESAAAGGRLSLDGAGAVLAVGAGGGHRRSHRGALRLDQPHVLAELVLGVACLAALGPTERRVRTPRLNVSRFASRQFSAINAATVLLYSMQAASLLVLQCELVLGYDAAHAGAVLIPSSAILLVLSSVSGALVRRVGARWLMTIGR